MGDERELSWVACSSCGAVYDVDARRVPPQGLTLRCPACGERFAFGVADLRLDPNPEAALRRAIDEAAEAEQWDVADRLYAELEARRRARRPVNSPPAT